MKRCFLFLVLILLGSGWIGGCGTPPPTVEKVTVQLSWFHSVEFAGFYAAVDQGYYAAENISVTLKPGTFDAQPWRDVAEGRADFGVTGGDSLVIARSQGLPLRAIGTLFRRSPVVLMALRESGIRTPKDMVGKRVGIISPGLDNTNDIQLIAMLGNAGIPKTAVNLVLIEDYGPGSLTSGQMDVYNGFSTDEAVEAQLQGLDINLIFPSDYGVTIYGNVLFGNEKLIRENPDLVARFVRATFKGYQYAIEHPDEAAALALKYDPTLDLESQLASMKAEIPLIDTGDAPLGTMDEAVWQGTVSILVEQGFIPAPIDLPGLYTNEFIAKASSK